MRKINGILNTGLYQALSLSDSY
jgi:hypothetical protein